MQDSNGYIWVGTDAGVTRFDGKRFENFSIDDGLPDNQILFLKEDHLGRIWFIAFNGEMSYFLNGKIYNSTTDPVLKSLKFNAIVVSVFEDSKHRLWFGTNKNMLFMLNGKSLTRFISKDQSTQFLFSHITEDRQGRISVSSNHCVHIYENGRFRLAKAPPLNPVSYKTVNNADQHSIQFLDQGGLKGRTGGKTFPIRDVSKDLITSSLGYFYADDKELWLSDNEGIHHLDEHGRVNSYIPGTPAVQVIRDLKNNMWFTTANGMYLLPRIQNRLYTINKTAGLSSNLLKSITADRQNNLWLGTDDGNIDILNKRTLRTSNIQLLAKKSPNGIKKLLCDTAEGSMYFAFDYGFGAIDHIYGPKKTIRYLRELNGEHFVVKDFGIHPNGNVAISISAGVALLNSKKDLEMCFDYLKEGKTFFSDRSYSVFFDLSGNLWFSNMNGLNKLTNDHILVTYFKNQVLTKRINDIKQQKNGTMILATDGYGLLLIKNNKTLYRFTKDDGLSSNICKKIFIQDNHIWVLTNNGLNRICLDGNKPLIESFEYTNPLLKTDVNDLYVDSDTAYFATNNGLVYFHNKAHHEFMEAPKALISSIITSKGKISTNDPSITLDPSDDKITFYYGAIDFQNQDIDYRYRLKSTNSWIETRNRRIEVSSLQPGKYSFEISARTNNSNWGPSSIINFELKAHFWQTNWFLILIFALAGFLFYRIAVVVTKRQKNKEQEKLLLKNKVLMLEQKALQAMMNPHFVFNVMNSIQHYINTKDTSSANKILTGFAKLIRKNLEICTKSFITLEEEIEYLKLYLTLEKKRFGDKLRYEIQVSPEIDKEETLVPSMLLQPYIENAIWHGIMPLENGGDVKISIEHENDGNLLILIADNGIGITNSLKHKKGGHLSKGMSLTQERINLLNKIEANPIQISVQQNGLSGTIVLIKIPGGE